PSASARSARRWSGPPPRWSPTTTCRRATTDGSRERGTGNRGSPLPMAERLRKRGRFRVRSPASHRSLFPVPRSRFTLDPMTPADPAASHAIPAPVPDEAVPEYVRALERAADYLPEEQRPLLRRAWAVGASAHAGQTRRSGEPYITHPVAVALVLAEQRVDVETLVAAILHDTLEDTPLTRAATVGEFGEAVADLVDGGTKLDKLRFADRQEAAAESFRKMMLAMARDLRVIMIKLADRLHNMRTLGAQSPEARARIARETLEIYAPIAQRLGMNLFKAELQDLGFRALHPWRHAVLEKRIRTQPIVRREALARIEAQLAQRLTNE